MLEIVIVCDLRLDVRKVLLEKLEIPYKCVELATVKANPIAFGCVSS